MLVCFCFSPTNAPAEWRIEKNKFMVKVIQKDNKELYRCEECGFHYADGSTSLTTGKELAEKCEAWCREHKSCNIEITAHAEENKKS